MNYSFIDRDRRRYDREVNGITVVESKFHKNRVIVKLKESSSKAEFISMSLSKKEALAIITALNTALNDLKSVIEINI